MKGRFLLDVVVAQRASIFKLLSGENQTLLVRRNARVGLWVTERSSRISYNSPFLVLDLGLDIIDCIRRFHLKGDRFSSETEDEQKYEIQEVSLNVNSRFNEDLHLALRGNQPEYNETIENMLTGRLYLSSVLSGGVFDKASRSFG